MQISGIIDDALGNYALTKNGAGALTLSGANTFTGGVKFEAGTLQITTNNAALGTGTLDIGATTGSTAVTLDSLTARSITNAVNVNQDFTYTGTNSLAT
jgi:autotransporter-associated beta strand protein